MSIFVLLFVTACTTRRGCDAFRPAGGSNGDACNVWRRPLLRPQHCKWANTTWRGATALASARRTTPEAHSETATAKGAKESNGSKFAGLMAAEASSPSGGFAPLTWRHDGGGGVVRSAVLPDDEVPPAFQTSMQGEAPNVPRLHNGRTLHYHPSLLTAEEATSLKAAAEGSGKFGEFDSRCVVVVEDGAYSPDDAGDGRPSLASLLRPVLDDKITPWARSITSVPTLCVADALVRSYDPADGRTDLAPHYDVSTFATVIVPLNDPDEYEGGLYVQSGAHGDTRREVPFERAGDAVLHRYDVMHGVHVRSGRRRVSLVVWYGESAASVRKKTVPWVARDANISVHAAFLYAVNSQGGLYGFRKDAEVAKAYYARASERGHALSSYQLSFLLFKEWCSSSSLSLEKREQMQSESIRLLALAAERGLASAQHELGVAYKQGYRGLRCDVGSARYWLGLAAEQGYGPSRDVLDDPSRWEG